MAVRQGGYSPYLKFAYDGKGTVHFVATEDHPRNFDNSLFHGFLRDGTLYHSNGAKVGTLSTSTDATVATWDFTKVFQSDPDHVAWMVDIELDRGRATVCPLLDAARWPRPSSGPGRHGSAVPLCAMERIRVEA